MAQKANLLSILEQHQALLWGNEANGKVIPFQLKSYTKQNQVSEIKPCHIENLQSLLRRVNHQCNIGALCDLSAKEIEEHKWSSSCFGVKETDQFNLY
jgi:hypothetical protein